MASELELNFTEDAHLTECMRIRAETLQQKNEKPQEGEKLLRANEYIYRLDFTKQKLKFLWWKVHFQSPGKLIVTGTSQHWTPDLTNLMNRQLLEPSAIFWNKSNENEADCYEADAQEFGERISEHAKIRKVMYFLFTFSEGINPSNITCSIGFKA
ncbi:olfactory marker protein [Bombina bombina]|uniref:olfactory marker protein-like n=1 Tax=Bombina bombina TaxID=8345 RepID=UPI00235A5B47|nr:olfactory marker protein-like [Bombina bombina]XP_053564667.1 olfactory marker protein [Bombina bombina]